MTNNDIFRRLRYLFDFKDLNIVEIFKLADYDVKISNVSNWLRKKDDPLLLDMKDKELAIFLNGLIIDRRGRQEGPLPKPENRLNNNIILRKLKIALNLKTDDILDLFASIDVKLSKHELSAFFRNPSHKSYRPCLDQYLRLFLNALQTRYKNKLGQHTKPKTNF